MTDNQLPVPDSYLGTIAWSLTGDHSMVEDLIQEGRIEVWDLARRKPGMPKSYYGKSAKFRMLEVIGNRRLTGAEESKGRHHTDVTDTGYASLDEEIGEDGGTLAEYAPGTDNTEGAELAYHDDQIIHAIRALPERERKYVYDRFWRGIAVQELPRLWQQIRPKLQEELAHLKGAI